MRFAALAWIARSIGPLALSQAFAMLCGLATTTVWARFLPVETYGEFRTALSAISFVSTFCLLGTAQAASMAAAQNRDGSLIPLVRNKMLASGAGSLGLAAAAAYYAGSYGDAPGIAAGLVVAAVLFPVYNVADIWQSWVNGKANFVEQALGRGAIALLNLGAVAGGAFFGVGRLWPILAAFMVGQAVVSGVVLWRAAARRANRDVDASILHYGQHASLALVFNSLLALDMVILSHFASVAEVAMFAIAMQFPEQLKTVFSVIGQAASPYIYRSTSVVETWKTLRRPFWLLCVGSVILGVIGILVLPPLTRWLFTERYAVAAEYGKWLWLTSACAGPTGVISITLLATRRPIFVYIPNVAYPILLASLYLLMARDGVEGMTVARVVATITLASFYFVSFTYCVRRGKRAPHSLGSTARMPGKDDGISGDLS